jgi:mRNA interferase MazF
MVKQGKIIWLDFDPQIGYGTVTEPLCGEGSPLTQKGRRPALVISNETFNNYSKLAIVCPITNTDKNHPFHVKLNEKTKTKGAILCDQIRTLDITARNYEYIENIPDDILVDVIDIVNGFIEKEE